MPQSGVGSMQGSTEGRFPMKVIFHLRLSSTKEGLPLKVIFHQRSSSTEGCPPPKVVFHQMSQQTKSQPLTLLRSVVKFFWHTYDVQSRIIEAACCLKTKMSAYQNVGLSMGHQRSLVPFSFLMSFRSDRRFKSHPIVGYLTDIMAWWSVNLTIKQIIIFIYISKLVRSTSLVRSSSFLGSSSWDIHWFDS